MMDKQINSFHGLFLKAGRLNRGKLQAASAILDDPHWTVADSGACALGLSGARQLQQFQIYSSGHFTIAGFTELYNRPSLNQFLASGHVADNDIALVLSCYVQKGTDVVSYLEGAFSFCIWDDDKQRLFCARDHVGLHPLYFHNSEKLIAVADSLLFLSNLSFAAELNEDHIVELLHGSSLAENNTVFQNIQSLQPGHWLLAERGKTLSGKYWSLDNTTVSENQSFDDAVSGLKWHLQDASRKRINGTDAIGVELSGGLDSSAIAAYAHLANAENGVSLVAFSNVFPPGHEGHRHARDEWQKSSEVVRHLGIGKHTPIHFLESPVILAKKLVNNLGHPDNYGLSFYQLGVYENASSFGLRSLFSGFGGDEGISIRAIDRYTSSLVRKKKVGAAMRHYQSLGLNLASAGYATLTQVSNLVSGKRHRTYRNLLNDRWNHLLLQPRILVDEKQRTAFVTDEYYAPHGVNERIEYIVRYRGSVKRLECGYNAAALYGVSYKYPFLDIRLLEYFLKIPEKYKANNLHGRGLLRAAIQNMLPATIVDQPKTGPRSAMTVPAFGVIPDVYFNEVKNWLLDLPAHHLLFDYWSREKLEALKMSDSNDEFIQRRYYNQLVCGAMFAIFVNKRQGLKFCDVE